MATTDKIVLIDVDAIASFHWDADLAGKLRTAREEKALTRDALSQLTSGLVSTRYISQLERPDIYVGTPGKGTNLIVTKPVVLALVEALGIELSVFFKVVEFSSPNPLTSTP